MSACLLLLSVCWVNLVGCNGSVPSEQQTESERPIQASRHDSDRGPGQGSDKPNRFEQAKAAIVRSDWQQAERLLRSHLIESPRDTVALELAGDLAVQTGNETAAIENYRLVLEYDPNASLGVRDKLAQLWMRAGQPFEAVAVLEATIERFPGQPEPRFDLAGLAALLGLEQPAVESLKWLAQHRNGQPEGLVLLSNPSRLEPDVEICRDALADCPSDRRAEYGLARMDSFDQRWKEVADRLEDVVRSHPDFLPAVTLYGRALVELNDSVRIERWHQALPEDIESSAEYWDIAGRWARQQGDQHAAAKAFWNAVRLDQANRTQTLVNLSTSLSQIGRAEQAKPVAHRADQIAALIDATKIFFERGSRSQSAAVRVAHQMAELGRLWEAEGWARWAVALKEEPIGDVKQQYLAIRSRLTAETPWQLPSGLVANSIDLSDLPNVSWAPRRSETNDQDPSETGQVIRLADQALSLGLDHTCELAAGTKTEGMWIYQSVGGGAAALDFDLDGWPDLALAMLDGQPLMTDSKPNRLFRNLAGRFQDVSPVANYNDRGFAQGIAVCDFNADGFPDLFDANIGHNRLLQNNGDGTFTDVTQQCGMGDTGQGSADWTTSAVVVDLNGDGHADLYEVNYCDGSEPYEKVCRTKAGQIASCTPLDFRAQGDRVWAGNGDGSFRDVTADWLPDQDAGRGLGVIAGQLDQRPGIDLYIANDMTRNHLRSSELSAPQYFLSESATIQGLATNARSLSQASMGMAVGDPDADGDLDFFLTHFSDDHNTYYEQVSGGVWQDRTYAVGLGKPSERMLGFGTQFVDFDNNGSLELIVANGHVSDLRHAKQMYEMPAQVFRRDHRGGWGEIDSRSLGDYFTKNHLGRALVTLDADRDGLVDALITQIHEPVALLMNESETTFPSIGLKLVATVGDRDAIGATVTMKVGGRKHYAQLTAGDGFMCSIQRRISIGMGEAAEANEVVVTWPSGTRQTFGTFAAGFDYLLVEGAEQPFQWRQHD